MIVEGYPVSLWDSNVYLVAAREGEGAVVVDAGPEAEQVVPERLTALGLTLEAVLLTHGHLDHIASAAALADAAGVPAYMHDADRWMFADPGGAIGRPGAAPPFPEPADLRPVADGDVIIAGGIRMHARHTPGHTPGHVVYLTDGIVFSGDLIFSGAIGRTDFPGGSLESSMESIRRVVLPLDDDVVVLGGHGPRTTVGRERAGNPFVLADARGELPRVLGL